MASLFDDRVERALAGSERQGDIRQVVEKEILHHDILREMHERGFLKGLTFFGGTCLRLCYGSIRLSEDLDFAGGAGFNRERMDGLAEVLEHGLSRKYGLAVNVMEPVRAEGNVDTWKILVITHPGSPNLPQQKIHVDVCAVESRERVPMAIINHYRTDLGTTGLIVQAESRRELNVDKLLAIAMRPNRVKNRDLWDFAWLRQIKEERSSPLLSSKLDDRNLLVADFIQAFKTRLETLISGDEPRNDFMREMRRFLPPGLYESTACDPEFWAFVVGLLSEELAGMTRQLEGHQPPPRWRMD